MRFFIIVRSGQYSYDVTSIGEEGCCLSYSFGMESSAESTVLTVSFKNTKLIERNSGLRHSILTIYPVVTLSGERFSHIMIIVEQNSDQDHSFLMLCPVVTLSGRFCSYVIVIV